MYIFTQFYRYIIASQDKSLQNNLYNVPAVPVMYFNGLSVILKAPSPTSIEHAHHKRQSKYNIVLHNLLIYFTLCLICIYIFYF